MRTLLLAHRQSIRTAVLQRLPGLPATATSCTTGAQLQDERQQVAAARNPHEGHHAGAQFRLNVQVIVRRGEHVLEDDEHDGCDDGGDNGEEGRKEGQNEERKGAEEDKGAATVGRVSSVDVGVRCDGLRGSRGRS